MHQVGLDPLADSTSALAQTVEVTPGFTYEGCYLHLADSYGCAGREAIELAAACERDTVANFAKKVEAEHGLKSRQVSVGSTPTACIPPADGKSLQGVTELHAGNYIVLDTMQRDIGSYTDSLVQRCALFIVTRILSVYPERGMILIDCGWTGAS